MNRYLPIICILTAGLWCACPASAETLKVFNDFDGDRKTDPAIYYPGSGEWWVFLIGSGELVNTNVGGGNYLPAPGDYDGDNKTDFVVFDSTTGNWWGKFSSGGEGAANFGRPGSWPVPADYDGDLVTDLAVYYPPTGEWDFYSISKGWSDTAQWGYLGDFRPWENPQTYTVLPMPFDYNQDGVDDLGYYYRGTNMPTSGFSLLYIGGGTGYYEFGSSGSIPSPGNYRSQAYDVPRGVCVYKVTTAEWFAPYLSPFPFELGTYGETLPVPSGDYDGNGYDDNTVYNYVTGEWTIIFNTGEGGSTPDTRTKISGIFGGPDAVPANIYSTIYALGRYSPKPW